MSKDLDKLRPADRPNDMFVYDKCVPAYRAGERVTLRAGQSLGPTNLETAGKVHLEVTGPRFELQPTDVLGVYPAEGSDNSPPDYLPHVTLARRTLPWERNGPAEDVPWLAILLIDERELPNFEGIEDVEIGAIQAIDPVAYERILDADNPNTDATDETMVTIVELPKALAIRALPKQEDIARFIHVRSLQSDTPLRQIDDDGDVVVVIGPRLPSEVPENTTPSVHHAFLVSLEGRDDLMGSTRASSSTRPTLKIPHKVRRRRSRLRGRSRSTPIRRLSSSVTSRRISSTTADKLGAVSPDTVSPDPNRPETLAPRDQPSDPTAIVVLHHWSFTPAAGSDDFESIVKAIRYLPNGGVLRFGTLPRAEGPDEPRAPLPEIVDGRGRLVEPLSYPQAQGGKAAYRGPLSPHKPATRQNVFAMRARPEEFEGGAVPQTAVERSDLAAFELGRLLALSDANVLSAMQSIMPRLRQPEIKTFYQVDPRPGALRFPDEVINPANRWGQDILSRIEQNPARDATSPQSSLTDYGGLGLDATLQDQLLNQTMSGLQQLELADVGVEVGTQLDHLDIQELPIEQLDIELAHIRNGAG